LSLSDAGGRKQGVGRGWAALFAVLSASLVALATCIAFLEIRPYFDSGLAIQSRIDGLADRNVSPGPSFASQRLVLNDCYATMRSLEARASPETRWRNLLSHCDTVSRDITEWVPAHGYAWLIRAQVAAQQGDTSALAARLERARAVAPYEGWLALERLMLAERAVPDDASLAGAGWRADATVLIGAGRPDPALVSYYLADEGFRMRFNAVLESQPAAAQSRFLAGVREQLPEANP